MPAIPPPTSHSHPLLEYNLRQKRILMNYCMADQARPSGQYLHSLLLGSSHYFVVSERSLKFAAANYYTPPLHPWFDRVQVRPGQPLA